MEGMNYLTSGDLALHNQEMRGYAGAYGYGYGCEPRHRNPLQGGTITAVGLAAAAAGTAEAAPPRISGRGGVSAISFTVRHSERIAQLIECLAASMSITYIVQPCTYALHHRNVVKTHFTAYPLVADSQVSAEYPSSVLCKHHIHLAGPDVLRRYPVNLTGFQPYSFYCLVHNFNPPYSSSNIVFPAHSGHFTMCLRNC